MYYNPFYFFFFVVHSLAAQPFVSTDYAVKQYTDEDGLPQNSVLEMYQDANQLLWLVTQNGLTTFNGKEFHDMDREFLGNSTYHFQFFLPIPESEGLIFYDLNTCYLKIEPNRTQFYKAYHINRYIRNMLDKLVGYPKRGNVFKMPYQQSPWYASHYNEIHIVPAATSSFYFLKKDSLFFFKENTCAWQKKLFDDYSYFYTSQGFYAWDKRNTMLFFSKNGSEQRWKIQHMKQLIFNKASKQVFFISESNDLYMFHEKGAWFEYLMKVSAELEVVSVLRSDKKKILLGTNADGLLLCTKKDFRVVGDQFSETNVYYAIQEHSDSSVVATNGYELRSSGVGVLHHSVKQKDKLYEFLGKDEENYYYQEDGYKMYRSTKNGRIHFDTGNVFLSYARAVSERDGDRLWFSDYGKNVYTLEQGKLHKVLRANGVVNAFLFLGEQYVLLGGDRGLALYNKRLMWLYPISLTRNLFISSIYKSPFGHIYLLVKSQGLFLLTKSGIKKLPLDKNEWLRNAHCTYVDRRGTLWISANKGLFCIPEKTLLNLGDSSSVAPYYYWGKENGFNTNEFNGGCSPCVVGLKNGEVVFPSMDGLVWFSPDSVYYQFPKSKPVLSRYLLDDIQMPACGDTIYLKSNFRRLELYYDVSFFGDRKNNLYMEYAYTHEGNKSKWYPLETNLPILFSFLRPMYTILQVRVRTGFHKNDYMYTTLVLYRKPTAWERPFIWVVFVVFFIMVILLFIKVYTIRLTKRNKELELAINEAHKTILENMDEISAYNRLLLDKNRFFNWIISSVLHDIRGPLKFLENVGSVYGETEETDNEEVLVLRAVFRSSKKIYAYSERLLKALVAQQGISSQLDTIMVNDLIDETVGQFAIGIKQKNIQLQIDVLEPIAVLNSMAFEIILHNLLDNSIKKQEGGRVWIRFSKEHTWYKLEIEDEAGGLSNEMLNKVWSMDDKPNKNGQGLGLWLVFSMVRFTHAKIEFVNTQKGLQAIVKWVSNESP